MNNSENESSGERNHPNIVVLAQLLKIFLSELKHKSLLNPAGLKKVNFIEINSSI